MGYKEVWLAETSWVGGWRSGMGGLDRQGVESHLVDGMTYIHPGHIRMMEGYNLVMLYLVPMGMELHMPGQRYYVAGAKQLNLDH